MTPIEIISASAGSGKTYTLAQLLCEEVTAGRVRPDAVLATTFSRAAAAELQERLRATLLASGQHEAAQRVSAARIGTVNSVCGRLVADFAFELGLSPRLAVLDDAPAAAFLKRTLGRIRNEQHDDLIAELAERLPEKFEVESAIIAVVNAARQNAIDADALRAMAESSITSHRKLFGNQPPLTENPDKALLDALNAFEAHCATRVDQTGTTAKTREDIQPLINRLRHGRALRWRDWQAMSGSWTVGVRSRDAWSRVQEIAANHERDPRLHRDMEDLIRLVYTLSADALDAYAADKRRAGVMDFTDQEVLALRLLDNKEARERLAEQLDLFIVDEFQDTSPLQLAIFARLSAIARRTVWVGDQKQAIYGFRGTDTALMEAALAHALGGAEPRTLRHSYRSRRGLVDFTSSLFATAFARQGIPAERVRLTMPEGRAEPDNLGDTVEVWSLQGANNRDADHRAVANGVLDLLLDEEARVWDKATGTARPIRAGDIGVLCMTNDAARAVAAALAEIGVEAVIPRSGLMATPEARLLRAILALWAYPGDSLALAEIARLLTPGDEPGDWMERMLKARRGGEFLKDPTIEQLLALREQHPLAGPVVALDLAITALDLRAAVACWPEAPQRLANIDALRAAVVVYTEETARAGAASTPAGAVGWLDDLAMAGVDSQGTPAGRDAVTVSTWHAAKGLEWHVTILHQSTNEPRPRALGVVVEPAAQFDFLNPLAGRTIRYWPTPYDDAQKRTSFHGRLEQTPEYSRAVDVENRQALRLLYVGMTRARDRLILALRPDRRTGVLPFNKGYLGAVGITMVPHPLADIDGVLEEGAAPLRCDLNYLDAKLIEAAIRYPLASPTNSIEEPIESPLPERPNAGAAAAIHPPAILSPSAAEGTGAILAAATIGPRIPIAGDPDMARLGEAIHGFLAADRSVYTRERRLEIARRLTTAWQVAHAISPESIVAAADRFREWAAAQWPDAEWRREWPIEHPQPNGALLRGRADLVLLTPAGFVLIDHKSFPGNADQARTRAASHAGQLAAYATAITATTGHPCLAHWIHLPLTGLALKVGA
jgi:ATP-dependent exoDNAse (exonuclease V) beta subunit